jgi:hypothetical protein
MAIDEAPPKELHGVAAERAAELDAALLSLIRR